jgi:TetR/AcrR family transcriptional regulator, transcriptional repressor for nem operon
MGRVSDARERLIEATIDLIWTESYGAASVDAICDRAGVKKGSFYHFFKSKDDLVIAALEGHWNERRPQLDELFARNRPPLDRLRAYFDNVIARQKSLVQKFGHCPGCLYGKLGSELGPASEIGKKVQEIMNAYYAFYETALIDAFGEGWPIADIPGKARALFAFMEGVLAQARIHGNPSLLDDLGKQAFRFLNLEKVIAA